MLIATFSPILTKLSSQLPYWFTEIHIFMIGNKSQCSKRMFMIKFLFHIQNNFTAENSSFHYYQNTILPYTFHFP